MAFEPGFCIVKRCHRNSITSLSVNGDKIASGGKDSTLLIHQRRESEIFCLSNVNLEQVNGSKCNVTCVDYSENLAVSSTTLGVVNIFDEKSQNLSKFTAHREAVSFVKFFTKKNCLLVTAGFDSKVRVWDLRSLKTPIFDLIGHTANVNFLDNLEFEPQDEDVVSFGENFERILSSASDRTVRLWNVNRGTHLAFKVPIEMSQNVESCCVISRKPHYTFAAGLDSEFVLVFSSKLKGFIGSFSVGKNVSVNCLRVLNEYLFVGTSCGDLWVLRLSFNQNYTKCELEQVQKVQFSGSLNDFRLQQEDKVTLYSAVGTEVRLGRWSTNLANKSKSQIVIQEFK